MRILVRSFLILLVAIVAVAVYLLWGVFGSPEPSEFAEVISRDRGMIELAPVDATQVLIIPSAGPMLQKISANQVASAALDQLLAERNEERLNIENLRWAFGNADLVVWRGGSGSGFIVRPDPIRRFLLPLFSNLRRQGDYLVSGEATGGFPAVTAVSLKGDAFIIHRDIGGEDAFPPVQKPAITAVSVDRAIHIRSVSAERSEGDRPNLQGDVRVPENAILTAAVASAPELIHRVEETLPVEITPLLARGGTIAFYQLHDDRFLPRPRGVLVLTTTDQAFPLVRRRLEKLSPELPFGIADEQRREVMGRTVVRRESIGFTLEYTRRGEELLVAFDKSSIEKYLSDTLRLVDVGSGGAEWVVRLDPQQLFPALERMREHSALRVLLPDLGRALDEVYQAIRWVNQATDVIAIKRRNGGVEEMEVTILPPK